MSTITTRAGKGSPLTNNEVDANFTNLNADKAELSGAAFTGNITFTDNSKAIFGAGSDLQIYHDGSNNHTFVKESGSGNLYVQANNLRLQSANGGNYAQGIDGDAFKLYFNDDEKLATTSTGIDVTGTATMDYLTVGNAGSDYALKIKEGSGDEYYQLGVDSYGGLVFYNETTKVAEFTDASTFVTQGDITVNGTANMSGLTVSNSSANADLILTEGSTNTDARIRNSNGILEIDADLNNEFGNSSMMFAIDGVDKLKINNNGDISFYDTSGSSAKFFWDASAESLGIGNTSPDSVLTAVNAASTAALRIGLNNTSYNYMDADNNIFRNGAGTERMRVDAAGNVGIGTNTPSSYFSPQLVVHSSSNLGGITIRSNATTDTNYLLFADGTSGNERYRGYVSYDHNADTMKLATGASPAITIDSSQNVGIGVSSPATDLHIKNAGSTQLLLESGNTDTGFLLFGDAQDLNVGSVSYNHSDNSMRFETSDSERARISASGELLIGKTTGAVNTAGLEISAIHGVRATVTNNIAALFNRTSSDGTIADFRKDGTTVGSIGSESGTNLTIGTGDTGIYFNAGADAVHPWNIGTNAARSGAIDLGRSADKFKDLYLSGNAFIGGNVEVTAGNGILLGGNAVANKLDDYEEGTWTPVTSSGSWTVGFATYTKVGNMVTCRFHVTATATISVNDFTGLPFTPDTNSAGICGYQNSESGEVYSILVQNSNVWNFRLASVQKGMANSSQVFGMFSYSTTA